MSQNRFLVINKFLHFVDNSAVENDDRLHKICPIIEHLCNLFQNAFTPSQYVAVDKSLLLWKSRLRWKQYIPKKCSRFSIKTYELRYSITGYFWNFLVCTGKTTDSFTESAMSDLSSVR